MGKLGVWSGYPRVAAHVTGMGRRRLVGRCDQESEAMVADLPDVAQRRTSLELRVPKSAWMSVSPNLAGHSFWGKAMEDEETAKAGR